MMAHNGGKGAQQQLLQRHHHQQRAQQQHQQRLLDVDDSLPHVPQDCAPRSWDQTSIVAMPHDLRSRSGYHRHHGGGASAFSNRLVEPKEESTSNRFEDEISIIPIEFLPGMDQPADQTTMSPSLKLFQFPNPDMSTLSLLSSDPGPGLQAGDMENRHQRPIREETGGPHDR